MESGTKLAHYEILSPLGKGGMGEVWRARDTKLGREVAIKTLPEEFARDAERLAQFEREAKLLASLNHPNIAAIYGLEESDGTRFLVLELVEGPTLGDRIKQGAVPVEESLNLALQIAEALQAAHEKGVIHRDLKPDNIKVTPEGKVKVLDFGLAKAFEGDAADVSVSNSPTLSMTATQAGIILGTAAYMSPEQAKGRTVDKRADVWAFGCVLYEMLTGCQVFAAEDVSTILARVLDREPDFTPLPANLNPRLRGLLRRCLQKDAKLRYHDMADARLDIQETLSDPSGVLVHPVVEVVQAPPQSRLPWVAAIAVTAVIASLAVWLLQPSPARVVSRFDYELPEGSGFANPTRPMVVISPDGAQFVYNATAGLSLRAMDELEARVIVERNEQSYLDPIFSPDSHEIAYRNSTSNSLMKIPLTGGVPIVLADNGPDFGMSWESNGMILYGQSDGIWQVSENGGTPVQLIATEDGEQAFGPQLLPGDEWVLFTLSTVTGSTQWDEADIVIESLSSGERRVLRQVGSDARYVPTGHLIYALGNVLFAMPFDVNSLELSGGPVSIVQGVRRGNITGTAQYSFSDDGTLVYVPGTAASNASSSLVSLDREGNAEVLSAPERDYGYPRFSPDNTRIAIEMREDEGGSNIWVYEVEDNLLNQLTFDGGERPLWLPDGSEVTFRNGDTLWTVPSDFSGAPTMLLGTELAGNLGPESWSPDGAALLFVSEEGIHAWRREDAADDASETAEVILPAPVGAFVRHPEFSPDGGWFLYTSNEAGTMELYANPFPVGIGGRQRITTATGEAAKWIRHRPEVIYSTRGGRIVLSVAMTTQPTLERSNPVPFSFSEQDLNANFELGARRNYDVSSDGERFILLSSGAADPAYAQAPPAINIVLNWFEELKERVPVP